MSFSFSFLNLCSGIRQKAEEYETKSNVGQPSPGHTRGKWVPGAQTDIESGYWCSPCGRKLASRLVYNRHLLSDLHARRSIREIDDVLSLPRAASLHAAKKSSSRYQVNHLRFLSFCFSFVPWIGELPYFLSISYQLVNSKGEMNMSEWTIDLKWIVLYTSSNF